LSLGPGCWDDEQGGEGPSFHGVLQARRERFPTSQSTDGSTQGRQLAAQAFYFGGKVRGTLFGFCPRLCLLHSALFGLFAEFLGC
jgi:hypothetical protein